MINTNKYEIILNIPITLLLSILSQLFLNQVPCLHDGTRSILLENAGRTFSNKILRFCPELKTCVIENLSSLILDH